MRNANLKQLMDANLDRISYDVAKINKKTMAGLSKQDFVPLADVPDMVWKVGPHKRGGMSCQSTPTISPTWIACLILRYRRAPPYFKSAEQA